MATTGSKFSLEKQMMLLLAMPLQGIVATLWAMPHETVTMMCKNKNKNKNRYIDIVVDFRRISLWQDSGSYLLL